MTPAKRSSIYGERRRWSDDVKRLIARRQERQAARRQVERGRSVANYMESDSWA